MDPRTFLRPRALALAPVPSVGSVSPDAPFFVAGRPTVVAFLRHVGCPFAETTLRDLTVLARSHEDIDVVAVVHAHADDAERWRRAFDVGDGDAVRLVGDPTRAWYAAWGLGLTGARHFAGARALTAAARLARRGIRNRHPVGTRWQQAGTFAVDAGGTVRWRHIPAHAGDLPRLEDAAAALAA